jgi:hypothetical protein
MFTMRETARQLANDTRNIAHGRRTKQHDSVRATRGHVCEQHARRANQTRDRTCEGKTTTREQHDSVQTTRGHVRHSTLTTHKTTRATRANEHAITCGTAHATGGNMLNRGHVYTKKILNK